MTLSVPIISRATLVDYAQPIVFASVSFLIPFPYQTVNLLSATKPFQAWVRRSLKLVFKKYINFLIKIGLDFSISHNNNRFCCSYINGSNRQEL